MPDDEHIPLYEEPERFDEEEGYSAELLKTATPSKVETVTTKPSTVTPSETKAPKKEYSGKGNPFPPSQKEINALLKKLNQQKLKCVTDISTPLPFNTLSPIEFSIAMKMKWLVKNEKIKRYNFTPAFLSSMEEYQANPPEQTAPVAHSVRPSSNAAPVQQSPRTVLPDTLPFDPKSLPTEAFGESQLKIDAIVYREHNRKNQPQLKLIGRDGNGKTREIYNGIPLVTAHMLVSHPADFQGKVVLIDQKNNFVGIPLTAIKGILPSVEAVIDTKPSEEPALDI